jgi:hypothetical protein
MNKLLSHIIEHTVASSEFLQIVLQILSSCLVLLVMFFLIGLIASIVQWCERFMSWVCGYCRNYLVIIVSSFLSLTSTIAIIDKSTKLQECAKRFLLPDACSQEYLLYLVQTRTFQQYVMFVSVGCFVLSVLLEIVGFLIFKFYAGCFSNVGWIADYGTFLVSYLRYSKSVGSTKPALSLLEYHKLKY